MLIIVAKILARYAAAAALCSARAMTEASNDGQAHTAAGVRANPAAQYTELLIRMSRAWGGGYIMSTTLNNGASDQSPPREAVQRVLRELHQVQRLLFELKKRKQSLAPKGNISHANSLSGGSPASATEASNNTARNGLVRSASHDSTIQAAMVMPLSSQALDVVESDVRRSLSALSTVVRAVLRCS